MAQKPSRQAFSGTLYCLSGANIPFAGNAPEIRTCGTSPPLLDECVLASFQNRSRTLGRLWGYILRLRYKSRSLSNLTGTVSVVLQSRVLPFPLGIQLQSIKPSAIRASGILRKRFVAQSYDRRRFLKTCAAHPDRWSFRGGGDRQRKNPRRPQPWHAGF